MAKTENPGAHAGATGAGIAFQAAAGGNLNITNRSPQNQTHETADCYGRVIARLNPHWRVIVCRDRLQWILQQSDGARCGQTRWKGVRYFVTRKALIRTSRSLCGRIAPDALATLKGLPENFGGTACCF